MAGRARVQFDSPSAESILRRHGLDNLDALFRAGQAARSRHVGRAVWKTELQDNTGQPFTAYVKLSWGRRHWPRLSDILAGQVFQSPTVREWDGLEQLSQIGLRVPQRIALFDEGLFWKRSALIVRAVPPPASISEMISSGAWAQLPSRDRHAIFAAVANTLDRIHSAGLGWCNISSRHIFPHRMSVDRWELWLSDCAGVRRVRSESARKHDLAKLKHVLSYDLTFEASLTFVPDRSDRVNTNAKTLSAGRRDRAAA